MTTNNLTWDRETSNEFSLWDQDGDWIGTLERSYEQKTSAHGHSLYVNDTEKPMIWTLILAGHSTRIIGTGFTVREAKKLALSIVASN